MSSVPLVTVIIPNYNHYDYLGQRINSVLNQTFRSFEVIIMDDSSTDNSRQIIEEYRNHNKVTAIVYNTTNSGSTFHQWNKGVYMAKGKYIWIAESDDLAKPEFLDTLVSALQSSPDAVLSYCQSDRITSEGAVFGDWFFQTDDLDKQLFKNDFSMQGADYISRFLIYRNTIPNASAVVFLKEAYIKAGGGNPEIKFCGDWLTWLKMLHYGAVCYTAQMLNSFRYHESSVIGSSQSMTTFWKKYDITMRHAYRNFLKTTTPPPSLYEKNVRLLRKDARKEFKFLLRKSLYLQSLPYLKVAAFSR